MTTQQATVDHTRDREFWNKLYEIDSVHDHVRATQVADRMRTAIRERGGLSPMDASRAYANTPRASAPARVLREDATLARSYVATLGIDPNVAAQSRLEGTWHLFTSSWTESDQRLLSTRSAIDPQSYLASNIRATVEDNSRLGDRRAPHPNTAIASRLLQEVDRWEAVIKGYCTDRGLTRKDYEQFRDEQPRRSEERRLADAALGGERHAAERCVPLIFEHLRTIDHGLLRHDGDALAGNHTWSVWSSKAHPDDQRLVITRRAIDAISYHALQPDSRTRYVSFDGRPTATSQRVLDRALELMPERSTVVIASEGFRGGGLLMDAVERALTGHPSLRVERHAPSARHLTWHDQLSASRWQDRPPVSVHCEPPTLQSKRARPARAASEHER